LSSRLGEGSIFRFKLPLKLDAQTHAQPVPTDDLRGSRVLIVDDTEVNRRVLHEHLSGWEMPNGSEAGGAEALKTLRAARRSGDPRRFVLFDYQIPRMDGAPLAAAIKTDPSLSDTVVIMLTSAGHWSEVLGMQAGAIDACLVKPVRQSQLLNTLATSWPRKLQAGVSERALTLHTSPAVRTLPGGASPGHALRILVAEDNAVNQKAAVRMLERLGVRRDVAANGRGWNCAPCCPTASSLWTGTCPKWTATRPRP
jgi:CheY-like chemotaxis protein